MPKLYGKMLLLTSICATTLLTSCATRTGSETDDTLPPPSLSVACIVFEPITASSRDTTETLRAIATHNRVWDRICD